MQIRLNKLQTQLFELVKEKGFITLDDVSTIWTTGETKRANLIRFVNVGILKQSSIVGRFDYNGTD